MRLSCFYPSHFKFIDQIFHRLISEYQKYAKCLKKTGDGVDDPNNDSGPTFYIEGGGPDQSTPQHAVNIWRMCFYYYIKYSSPICLLFLQRRSLQHGHTFPNSMRCMLAAPMSTLSQL